QPNKFNVEQDLKIKLEQLIKFIFKSRHIEIKWEHNTSFPFTEPSYELYIRKPDKTGGAVASVKSGGKSVNTEVIAININYEGWAFGIGLERIAMLLYNIPDIRLFWSQDERFINQFKENEIIEFSLFSNYPAVVKDISFYLNDKFNETTFFQICRDIAYENIELVKKIDHYYNKKTKQTSVCYRIIYRSHSQNLTHEFVNEIQNSIIQMLLRF
uniref:phenylalanine--tRNA ligase n=1 Tax=Piliocolobus tephrosceles TaxID=591936 RepID=A0A8C9GU26_9PRIM